MLQNNSFFLAPLPVFSVVVVAFTGPVVVGAVFVWAVVVGAEVVVGGIVEL